MKKINFKNKSFFKKLLIFTPIIITTPAIAAACRYDEKNGPEINNNLFQTTQVTVKEQDFTNQFYNSQSDTINNQWQKASQDLVLSLRKFAERVFLRSYYLYYIHNFALLNDAQVQYELQPIQVSIKANDDQTYDLRIHIQSKVQAITDQQLKKINELLSPNNLYFATAQAALDHFNQKLKMDCAYNQTSIYTAYVQENNNPIIEQAYAFNGGKFDRIVYKSGYDSKDLKIKRKISQVNSLTLDLNTPVFQPVGLVEFYQKPLPLSKYKKYDIRKISFVELKNELRKIQNSFNKDKPHELQKQDILNLAYENEFFQIPYFLKYPQTSKPDDLSVYPVFFWKQITEQWKVFNNFESVNYETLFDEHHLALINPFFYQDVSMELVQGNKNFHCHSDGLCHATT
ncbi:hypothetical protein [Ureaplasma zalophigenitalium]|uniref:Iron ABC transporter substrate-binding protein n=1 Tax=Ureaplasma zalophigenitalium TaxID=907723 RepID=A0ABT3BPF7_9BACT|nr:hypothetical protein [Ureaplasma zalophigenitalium]MCV3754134.1 hypothetical protein [Ureaplasma zalophigenitalium]